MPWDDDHLPLFNCNRGRFVQIIKFEDQIPRKRFVLREITVSFRDPEWLVHVRYPECATEYPHQFKDCGIK